MWSSTGVGKTSAGELASATYCLDDEGIVTTCRLFRERRGLGGGGLCKKSIF
jgi:hypothetical protein